MKGVALIYHTFSEDSGHVERHELSAAPKLDYLQGAVGGYIEAVPGFDSIVHEGVKHPCVAFCNEEGKLQGLSINKRATKLWHEALPPPGLAGPGGNAVDVLCGSIIVLYGDTAFMDEL